MKEPYVSNKRFIELYNSGYTDKEIADICGFKNYAYISNKISNLVCEGVIEPRTNTYIDKGKIRALHNAGWSNDAIAKDMYIKVASVMDALKEGKKNG
jgi:hypothetical protein